MGRPGQLPGGVRRWLYEHSLRIVLGLGFVVFSLVAWPYTPEDGNFMYDLSLMIAGSFGGSFLLVFLARYFWDKDADPTTPPRPRK